MKIINKYYFWIVPILAGFIFSERVVSYFVVRLIPADLILQEYNFPGGMALILKFFPYIILTAILILYERRFKSRYLLAPLIIGLAGIILPMIRFYSQLTESYVTSLKTSSTFGLSYLVIPILALPYAIAGIFAALSGILLFGYIKSTDTVQPYQNDKRRRTFLIEGLIYLILSITLASSFYIWQYPFTMEENASSVRTRERKLENYFIRANEESNYRLLSSLASNPKLPAPLIEEIYDSALVLRAFDDKKYLNLFSSLANNIKTPEHILSFISEEGNSSINTHLALNPNTSAAVLIALAKHGSVAVKISVSRNPKTPGEALTLLSGESHYVIRLFVARHKNVTGEILLNLTKDEDDRVKSAALKEIEKFQK